MEEKRKNQRVNVSFPTECNLLPDRNYFCTVSKDLSSGGARIIANQFIPKGKPLKLCINMIDKLLRTKAEVRWCNKEGVSDRYSVGLEFIEVNRAGRDALSLFLNRT